MFEPAVRDGFEQFRFEKEVAEGGRVNANIAAFPFIRAGSSNGQVALLGITVGGGGAIGGGLDLLVGVVDEVLFSRHGGDVAGR